MNADARERIGVYRIVRRLGSGGMGEVFLAYDERLDRLVAIKRVRPEAAADADRRERLRREARAAARLSHPNVVQVFDLIEDEGGDSIVFEYVQGRTVTDLIRDRGPLAVAAAAGIAGQVADGLAAAHGAGLVHRDLKGENVVVTPEGRAKILDFGLVKPLDPGAMGAAGTLTEGGAVLGTWRAMSPEQAGGEAVDARSDLFSLGVLLYEMLAGRSPFAGRSPAEILRNVLAAAPAPLGELRPEVPAELAGLVHALLEKDPARRPPGAGAVAARLRGLGDWTGASGAPPPEIGDVPTSAGGPAPAPDLSPHLAPRLEEPLAADRRPESLSRALFGPRGWRRAAAVLAVVAAVGVAAVPALPWLRGLASPEPLRVAVLPPSLSTGGPADDEALGLAASGAVVASLRGLLALEGVTAVEPSQIGEIAAGPGGAVAAARSVAADEALTAALGRDGPAGGRAGSLSLRRIRTADGSVLWAERLPVPLAPEDALVLATAVEAAVRRAYPERRPLAGQAGLEVRAEDYAELIRIKQRLDAGRGAWAPELARLEAVTAGSPRFAEAHLQTAALALNLYSDSRDAAHLARARAALERARGRSAAPADPRLLAVEIRLALVERRWDRAEELLAELEERSPGDVLVPIQRSRLAEAQGRLDEAIELLREVVARRPAWRDLMRLADLEIRRGDVPAARGHLEQASGLVPGNDWPLAKLGELELLYGEPRRAESIYRRLAAAEPPQRSDLTNLGLARALLGDFAGAAASYRRALEVEPGHTAATLNLADAELALGNAEAARRLYAATLEGLATRPDGSPLQPVEHTVRAQCLARLGRGREAVALALETFQAHPGDAEVAYQTALVLALEGDDAAALAVAGKALDLGIRPRWFSLPGFERLRADPDLGRRLAGDSAAARGALP